MDATHTPTDPIALLDQLDPEAIAARLIRLEREREALDRDRAALRILLRSARARQAAAARRQTAGDRREGARHAS
jgi:hypothetical protein